MSSFSSVKMAFAFTFTPFQKLEKRGRLENAGLEHDGEASKKTAENEGRANGLQHTGSGVLLVAALVVAGIRTIGGITGKSIEDASACAGSGWAGGSGSRCRGCVGLLGILSTAPVILGAGVLLNVVAHVFIDAILDIGDASVVRNRQTVLGQVGSLIVAANAGVLKGFSIAVVAHDWTEILLLADQGTAGHFVHTPVLPCGQGDRFRVDINVGGDESQGAGKSQEGSAVGNHCEIVDLGCSWTSG